MNFKRKMVDINSWPRVTWITCYMAAQPTPCCTPYIIIIIMVYKLLLAFIFSNFRLFPQA